MPTHNTASRDLAIGIVDRVESLILEAEQETRPLEVDPYRGQLFELFVTAEASGLTTDESDPDLSADGIARELSQRWNLAEVTQQSFVDQTQLPADHLAKMRMLWSFMRMWMEWTYAWQRWPEFHDGESADSQTPPDGS